MIAIELSKQKALDTDPKLIQQINFTGNLQNRKNITMFFRMEEAKRTILGFLQSGIIRNLFCFNIISE